MAALKLHGSSANVTGYQLGDCLGRGAFGQVYRGLNWTTGETVAVKQIQLGNIPKSELGEIMSEIDLLKNLKHPNIVKYKGSEKTKEYLYIILEYCENGSLQHICKRFGKFPEGLVGVYISQVLTGLIYLHDQGVIHRDIKGANILTTKDGSVKLADFGVATRTGNITEGTVVGSPYWMAPEVIDQSGATTASDVWSVGCVVIELLEGKPPYSFLEPMPALFRIVQDDNPPLPEGASPIVKDFLLHCFQKDFNLRVSARKLSRHPWMVASRKQLDAMKSGGSIRSSGGSGSSNGLGSGTIGAGGGGAYDEAVKSVQEWNEALKEPPNTRGVNAQRSIMKEVDGNGNLGSNNGNHSTLKASISSHHHPSTSASNQNPTLRRVSGPFSSNLNHPPSSNLSLISESSPNTSFPSIGSNKDYGNVGNKTPTRKIGRVFSRPPLSSIPGLQSHSEEKKTSSEQSNSSNHQQLTKEDPHSIAHLQGPDSPQTSFSIHPNPNPNLPPISAGRAAPAPSLIDQRKVLEELQKPEDVTDNWDDDFEDGIDTFKIARLERSSEEKEKEKKKNNLENQVSSGGVSSSSNLIANGKRKVIEGGIESSRNSKSGKGIDEHTRKSSSSMTLEDKSENFGDSGTIRVNSPFSINQVIRGPNSTLSIQMVKNRNPIPEIDSQEWDEVDENDNARTIRPLKSPSSPPKKSPLNSMSIPEHQTSKAIAPLPSVSVPTSTSNSNQDSVEKSEKLSLGSRFSNSESSSNLLSNPSLTSSTSSSINSKSDSKLKNIDDYSDLVSDEEEEHLDERIRNLRLKNSIGRRLFHPNDLTKIASSASTTSSSSSLSSSSSSSTSTISANPNLRSNESEKHAFLNLDPSSGISNSTPQKSIVHQRGSSSPGTPTSSNQLSNASPTLSSNFNSNRSTSTSGLISPPGSRNNSFKLEKEKSEKLLETRKSLGKYSEEKEEDWSDVFGRDEVAGSSGVGIDDPIDTPTLQLTTRLSNRSWLGDADADEDDPFAEIDEEEFAHEADLEANVARDKHARMCSHIVELVEALTPNAPEEELTEACEQLDVILTDMPEMKAQVLSSHGALAIIQLLEVTPLRDVICRLLGLLNLIIYEDPGAQENLCLIGAIPVVMSFTTKKFPHEVRLEAAHFVFSMCSTSSLTLQFVLSCRGLKTLVELIDEDYNEQKDLVWLGVACVNSVLELQSPASRNDFCRMLAQEGLLEPLSTALISVVQDTEDEFAESAKAHILHTFLIYSQSDSWLKKKVATRGVLRRMLQSCPLLEPQSLTLMLKVIKNLSMSPVILDELQNCNAIEILTRTLADHYDKEHGTEMSNQILTAMYNLCRLNKSRQEEAAQAGIIPQLLRVAQTNSPLKQFALPILCDFAHAGKPTRKTFWQHSGLSFYLKLLEDPYWQVSALESILVWLTDETARVEDVLLRSTSIDSLLYVFTTAKANSFENLLEPFLKILRLSNGITTGMAKFPKFFKRLIDRLKHQKAVVRLNLLRIAKLVCDVHPERQGLIEHYGLFKIIEELSQKDGAILVRELAREILSSMQPEAPISIRNVRRTTSESNVSLAASLSSSSSDGTRTPPSVPSPTRRSNLSRIPLGDREKSSTNSSSNLNPTSSTISRAVDQPSKSSNLEQPNVIRRSPSRSAFAVPPRRPTTGRTRDFSDS